MNQSTHIYSIDINRRVFCDKSPFEWFVLFISYDLATFIPSTTNENMFMFLYLSSLDVNITLPSLDMKTAFQIFLRLSLNFSMNNMHSNCFRTKEKNDFMITTTSFSSFYYYCFRTLGLLFCRECKN